MLSEASDIVICYALVWCIKANVEKEESYTVCMPAAITSPCFFYSFNSLETHTGIGLSCSTDISPLRFLCAL